MMIQSAISSCTRRRRRGTAEIELLLTVLLLSLLLLLARSAARLAQARLDTAQSASVEANRRAAGLDPQGDDVPVNPVKGYSTIREGLPLRAHAPKFQQEVPVFQDKSTTHTTTISTTALSISPAWQYPADPIGGGDYQANEDWFMDYAAQGHGPLTQSLQLAPAWPP